MLKEDTGKLLIACYGLGGIKASHLLRPWHIANYLYQRGWEVEFAGTGKYINTLLGKDFPNHPISDLEKTAINRSIKRYGYAVYSYELLKRMISEELSLFEARKPDLILGDYRRSLSISARAANIPLISLTNASWTRYSSISNWSKTVTASGSLIAPFNKVRSIYGLSEIESIDDALEGDITILADIEEFSPSIELPKNYRYVGPIYWEDSLDLMPVAQLLPKPTNELITVDFGVHYNSDLSSNIRTILKEAELSCIEIKHTEEKFRNRPIHILSKNYSEIAISHAGVAVQRSSLLLTTGHLETLYRAIRYKIPVLGIPQSEEESWYIKRIVDLGLGITLPSTMTGKSLPSVITELIMNKSSDTLAANELAKAVARHNAQKEVGEIISTKGGVY